MFLSTISQLANSKSSVVILLLLPSRMILFVSSGYVSIPMIATDVPDRVHSVMSDPRITSRICSTCLEFAILSSTELGTLSDELLDASLANTLEHIGTTDKDRAVWLTQGADCSDQLAQANCLAVVVVDASVLQFGCLVFLHVLILLFIGYSVKRVFS